jgi:hypothetical protein
MADEIQSKFGENALWVYELLRYDIHVLSPANVYSLCNTSGIDRTEGILMRPATPLAFTDSP